MPFNMTRTENAVVWVCDNKLRVYKYSNVICFYSYFLSIIIKTFDILKSIVSWMFPFLITPYTYLWPTKPNE